MHNWTVFFAIYVLGLLIISGALIYSDVVADNGFRSKPITSDEMSIIWFVLIWPAVLCFAMIALIFIGIGKIYSFIRNFIVNICYSRLIDSLRKTKFFSLLREKEMIKQEQKTLEFIKKYTIKDESKD